MPKRSQGKRSKAMRKQQDELRRVKEASLEQLLREKHLYRHGMTTKEMRDLCKLIQQSMVNNEMFQRSIQSNETFPDDQPMNTMEPSDSKEKVYKFCDQPSYGQTSRDVNFSSVTSPGKSRNSAEPNPSCWEADDSDNDGFYSPEFPGPCCRKIHIVQVEVHPEPVAGDEEETVHQNEVTKERIISPRKRQEVPANEWDSIDEF